MHCAPRSSRPCAAVSVASDRRLPVSCHAARRLIAGAFPMNSTMWKIALRTLARDKSYALINVAGLALAVACCLVLGVYLRSELTYDQSHVNHARIFRVVNEFTINGKVDTFPVTSGMLGPMLKDENADIQAVVRFQGGGGGGQRFIKHGDAG